MKDLFPQYYALFDKSMQKYKTQPFFNRLESVEERVEFVRTLRVTHVIVDPMYYQEMTEVLTGMPDRFQKIYDDGNWAVFVVTQR